MKREDSKIKQVDVGGKWAPKMEKQQYLQRLFYKATNLTIDSHEKFKFLANCIEKVTIKIVDGS